MDPMDGQLFLCELLTAARLAPVCIDLQRAAAPPSLRAFF